MLDVNLQYDKHMCAHMHRYAHTRRHMFTRVGTTHTQIRTEKNLFTFSGTGNTFFFFGTNHVCQLAKLPMYHYPKITTALISDNTDHVLISEMFRSSLCLQYRKQLTYLEQKIFCELWECLQICSSVVGEPFLTCHVERKTRIPPQILQWKEEHVLWSQNRWFCLINYATQTRRQSLGTSLSFSQKRGGYKLCILGWLTIIKAVHFHLLSIMFALSTL